MENINDKKENKNEPVNQDKKQVKGSQKDSSKISCPVNKPNNSETQDNTSSGKGTVPKIVASIIIGALFIFTLGKLNKQGRAVQALQHDLIRRIDALEVKNTSNVEALAANISTIGNHLDSVDNKIHTVDNKINTFGNQLESTNHLIASDMEKRAKIELEKILISITEFSRYYNPDNNSKIEEIKNILTDLVDPSQKATAISAPLEESSAVMEEKEGNVEELSPIAEVSSTVESEEANGALDLTISHKEENNSNKEAKSIQHDSAGIANINYSQDDDTKEHSQFHTETPDAEKNDNNDETETSMNIDSNTDSDSKMDTMDIENEPSEGVEQTDELSDLEGSEDL